MLMLAVTQGSSLGVGADDILLDFWVPHPETGRLTTPYSIQYQLWDMAGGAPAQITAGWVAATEVSTGRYCVVEDLAEDATAGQWEVRWQWTVVDGGATYEVRRDFEVTTVLWTDPSVWLCLPYELRDEGFDSTEIPEKRLQAILTRVGQYIRGVTGRSLFGAVGVEIEARGEGTSLLVLPDPIIGLSAVTEGVIGNGVRDGEDYILDDIEVMNRHLRVQGAGGRDDRDLPGLLLPGGRWPHEYLYWLTGVFGYTDPDIGTPGPGHIPLPLRQAAVKLAIREAPQKLVFDEVEDRTNRHRTQSDRMGSHGSAFYQGRKGAITGDPDIDDVLLQYMRPPGGVVV